MRIAASVRLRGETPRFVSRGGEKLAGALADSRDRSRRQALPRRRRLDRRLHRLSARGRREPRRRRRRRLRPARAESARGSARRSCSSAATPARSSPATCPAPIELVSIDVSFISVRLLLPVLARLAPAADWLVLVKPQFEVGKGRVGKGGVVRDDALAGAGGPRCPRGCGGARVSRWSGRRRAGSRGPREIARCSCTFVRGLLPRRAPRRAWLTRGGSLLSYACSPERFPWP